MNSPLDDTCPWMTEAGTLPSKWSTHHRTVVVVSLSHFQQAAPLSLSSAAAHAHAIPSSLTAAMASDPRPTILTEPSSSPAHGGSVFNPVSGAEISSLSSHSSATAHPTPTASPPPRSAPESETGDEAAPPPPKGARARVGRALKWVVGYDDAAPGTIGSSEYLRELTHDPWQQVRRSVCSTAPS
jgi:hypothetical protein